MMVSSKCRVNNLIIFFCGQRGAPIANPISVCCAPWEDLCPLGGVPLDDTTVEQSLEHLIVTRWRTSDRLPMQGMLFQILSRQAVQLYALCSVKHEPVAIDICNLVQYKPAQSDHCDDCHICDTQHNCTAEEQCKTLGSVAIVVSTLSRFDAFFTVTLSTINPRIT